MAQKDIIVLRHTISGEVFYVNKNLCSAFSEGGMIPERFTCDGSASPHLSWGEQPAGTKSITIICNDPDAPGWQLCALAAVRYTSLNSRTPENVPPDGVLSNGAKQGVTDFDSLGYGGPCPPGGVHKYVFKIFALNALLGLPAGASEKQVLKL